MEKNSPTETIGEKKGRVLRIIEILEKAYPNPQIALRFNNPLELLVATILSAQCTDERVNKVTETLFKKYRRPQDYASTDLTTLEEDVRSTGFYKNKARAIKEAARKMVNDFEGNIPQTMAELLILPGVGRKTASIILGNAFGKEAIAVDTHVKRVSGRLGLVQSEDPDKIEEELKEIIPPSKWTLTTNLLIWHGRIICQARSPKRDICPLRDLCPWEG